MKTQPEPKKKAKEESLERNLCTIRRKTLWKLQTTI